MTLRWRTYCRCRGGVSSGLLIMLATFGALGAAAVYVGPRALQAGAQKMPDPMNAQMPRHQTQLELFSSMVARSRGILALHDRGPQHYEEMLLWIEDRQSPGTIELSELALISHSRILQTITMYTLEVENADSPAINLDWQDPSFCEVWRTNPQVQKTVLVAGISDLDLKAEPLIQGGSPALRITFTWASDTADGSDKASTLVEVDISETGLAGDI